MNITREAKKEEAIKRMKAYDLFNFCIQAFEKRDEVQLTEPWGGLYEFSDNEFLNKAIKEYEEKYNSLVYHVIHTHAEFGELYNLLMVSDYEDEWPMDRRDTEMGLVYVYCINVSVPEFSEHGTIQVRNVWGGLVRTA